MIAEKSFSICLNTTIFLALFELASGYSFYMLEISLALLLLSLIVLLYYRYKFNISKILHELAGKLKYTKFTVIVLLLYLLFDFITLFYSQDFLLSLNKYKVVILMLFLSKCIMLYCTEHKKTDVLLINIASAGLFSSIVALINTNVFAFLPVYYNLRLSLRADYNVFATVILMGLIIGSFFVMLNINNNLVKHILLFVICVINVSVIFLSGSRRIFLIMPFVVIIIYSAFFVIQKKFRNNSKQYLYITANFIAAVLAVCAVSLFINNYMKNAYLNGELKTQNGYFNNYEATAEERYETIVNGSFIKKRKILWSIAINEFKAYKPLELLIGRGSSYDIILYDNTQDSQLDSIYPNREAVSGLLSAHNMLLADMLNGGIIKLLLACFMIASITLTYIRFLIADFFTALPYCISMGVVVVNSMISNRFGILYDKYFYIILFLSIIEISFICKNQHRLGR